jgi:hypothetical protein
LAPYHDLASTRDRGEMNMKRDEPVPTVAAKSGVDTPATQKGFIATHAPRNAAEGTDRSATRTLILHYHLFKNAGTSVDEMLQRNFGAQWVTQEFHVPRRDNASAVRGFLVANPQLAAISSHTALLPPPHVHDANIFPIVFIRHPIDRLRSAYEFERMQNAGTLGSQLAKEHDFAGYLRELLKNRHHRQVRNFQTFRLSHCESPSKGSELERAFRAMDALPFVGLVEAFQLSLDRLETQIRTLLPAFRAAASYENVRAKRGATLEERLALTRMALGDDFYGELCAANREDLALHERVSSRFRRFSPE